MPVAAKIVKPWPYWKKILLFSQMTLEAGARGRITMAIACA
ncbi:MAG: hypothetical protein ACP5E2_13000 [Terracidiphilus sp.]